MVLFCMFFLHSLDYLVKCFDLKNVILGRTCRDRDEFTCSNNGDDGHCIPKVWVCDLDNDCADSIDELNCGESV